MTSGCRLPTISITSQGRAAEKVLVDCDELGWGEKYEFF